MKIKAESPPTRCEVCHQADCFDAAANHCSRCGTIPLTAEQREGLTTKATYIGERPDRSVKLPAYQVDRPRHERREPILKKHFRSLAVTALIGILYIPLAFVEGRAEAWLGALLLTYIIQVAYEIKHKD